LEEFHHDNLIAVNVVQPFPSRWMHVIRSNQHYVSANAEVSKNLAEDRERLYVIGKVHYRDIYNRGYETAFCLSYNFGNDTVRPEGEADYNYQT
jgi:hypothetical protein